MDNGVAQRLSRVEEKLSQIDDRFNHIDEQIAGLRRELQDSELKSRERFDKMSNQMDELLRLFKTLKPLDSSAINPPHLAQASATPNQHIHAQESQYVIKSPTQIQDLQPPMTSDHQDNDGLSYSQLPLKCDRNDEEDFSLTFSNRDNLLKKLELPFFGGNDTHTWLCLGKYCLIEKFELVSLSLSKKILMCFGWEISRAPFKDWQDLTSKFLLRFGQGRNVLPFDLLFTLIQLHFIMNWVEVSARKQINHCTLCKDYMIINSVCLLMSIAKICLGTGMNIPDGVEEDYKGLVKRTEKFDAKKGFKFSTSAHWWIKQALQKYFSIQSRMMRLLIYMAAATDRVQEARKKRYSENGRCPTNVEVAVATRLSITRLMVFIFSPSPPRSLDQKNRFNPHLKHLEVLSPSPPSSHICLMLKVSLLKPVLGRHHKDASYNSSGNLEVLIMWEGMHSHDNRWMDMREVLTQFPALKLVGKLVRNAGVIDMPWKAYIRRKERKQDDHNAFPHDKMISRQKQSGDELKDHDR